MKIRRSVRGLFAICALVSTLWLPTAGTSQSTPVSKESGFFLVRMGHGSSADGHGFSQSTYQRYIGGEIVFVLMIHYDSPEDARRKFEFEIGKATKIIEHEGVTGEKGLKEQRAVINTLAKDKNTMSMILVTAGSELREIQSYSLQNVLELEKQIAH
jgi:hypothetical protein